MTKDESEIAIEETKCGIYQVKEQMDHTEQIISAGPVAPLLISKKCEEEKRSGSEEAISDEG